MNRVALVEKSHNVIENIGIDTFVQEVLEFLPADEVEEMLEGIEQNYNL